MTIDIGTLDQEQQDALAELLADYNATQDTPKTREQYLGMVLTGIVADKMRSRYERALSELGAAAKGLDYASRQALIAQVKSAIGG